MQWSLDWTVGSILAASAVISPIITAIINNKHLAKMRKMDREDEKYKNTDAYKRKLIETYLQKTAGCINNKQTENNVEYSESFGRLVAYVSGRIQKQMIEIDGYLHSLEYEKARVAFIELIPQLTDIVQKL